jgi:hypothetical protein
VGGSLYSMRLGLGRMGGLGLGVLDGLDGGGLMSSLLGCLLGSGDSSDFVGGAVVRVRSLHGGSAMRGLTVRHAGRLGAGGRT